MRGRCVRRSGPAGLVHFLPRLRAELDLDLVIANVENAAAGYGVTPALAKGFLEAGVDVMTSGNHIWDRKEIVEYIVKENLLLRPANYPAGTPGVGSVVVKAGAHPPQPKVISCMASDSRTRWRS